MTATTVDVGDLRRALRVTLPFTDRGGMPVMECVHLEAAHNNLVATATDRYTLGHLRILAAGDPLPSTLLNRRDARLLRRALDDQPGQHTARIRRVRKLDGPDRLEVETERLTIRLEVVKGKYPDVAHLFEVKADDPSGLDAPANLNPELMRPFAKAAKVLNVPDVVRWTFRGTKKPVRVEIGRTFVGLIMPRSFPHNFDPAPVPVGLVKA
ncbi:hypothetical protein [Micromonospora sp. WMMD1274]|uniref:hypothetical protein n=1 Tax=Micromonospora sp. WMMD1274 TaxID=3404116 RepID=UPI003B94C55C